MFRKVFNAIKGIHLSRKEYGTIPTAQDMITYKDLNTWSI